MAKIGRPRVDNDVVTVRLATDLLARIDSYRRTAPDLPSRPEVIRRALADWLEKHGVD